MKEKKVINIYQVLPTIMIGDGVSQDAIEIEIELRAAGFNCMTYADSVIGAELKKKIKLFSKMPETSEEDIILYHLSTGSHMAEQIKNMKGKLIICYHNITPSHWFAEYDKQLQIVCAKGREDIKLLRDRAIYCLADSAYNAQELRNAGYQCPIKIFPIILNFERFNEEKDNQKHIKSENHVLFTGRIVPNKKIEDVIETFYYLKKYYKKDAVLDLVGNFRQDSLYYKKLKEYVRKLKVENVVFHGHVSEEKLVSIYERADVYLSLSEHEGFCIPLLEAMFFEIPVIAYRSGAVGETMQNAGVLLDNKEPLQIAGVINYILDNKELVEEIQQEQNERIKLFRETAKDNMLKEIIDEVLLIKS